MKNLIEHLFYGVLRPSRRDSSGNIALNKKEQRQFLQAFYGLGALVAFYQWIAYRAKEQSSEYAADQKWNLNDLRRQYNAETNFEVKSMLAYVANVHHNVDIKDVDHWARRAALLRLRQPATP